MRNVAFVNEHKCMTPNTPGREKFFSPFLSERHFSQSEIKSIRDKAGILSGIYPQLTSKTKETLLHPHIFPVMLGVKSAYFRYEREPAASILAQEISQIPKVTKNFRLMTNPAFIINLDNFRKRLNTEGEFLAGCGYLNSKKYKNYINTATYEDLATDLYMFLHTIVEGSDLSNIMQGFLIGYPVKSIIYAVAMAQNRALDSSKMVVNLYSNSIVSEHDLEAFTLLTRWENALSYGYHVFLKEHTDFWKRFEPGLKNSFED